MPKVSYQINRDSWKPPEPIAGTKKPGGQRLMAIQRPRPEILPCDYRKETGGVKRWADVKALPFFNGRGAGTLEVARPPEKLKGGFRQARSASGPGMEAIGKGVGG